MKIGQKISYDGHRLDAVKGDTTITRRVENGIVTHINQTTGWIEVTLDSGMRVFMPETKMKYVCGEDVKGWGGDARTPQH